MSIKDIFWEQCLNNEEKDSIFKLREYDNLTEKIVNNFTEDRRRQLMYFLAKQNKILSKIFEFSNEASQDVKFIEYIENDEIKKNSIKEQKERLGFYRFQVQGDSREFELIKEYKARWQNTGNLGITIQSEQELIAIFRWDVEIGKKFSNYHRKIEIPFRGFGLANVLIRLGELHAKKLNLDKVQFESFGFENICYAINQGYYPINKKIEKIIFKEMLTETRLPLNQRVVSALTKGEQVFIKHL